MVWWCFLEGISTSSFVGGHCALATECASHPWNHEQIVGVNTSISSGDYYNSPPELVKMSTLKSWEFNGLLFGVYFTVHAGFGSVSLLCGWHMAGLLWLLAITVRWPWFKCDMLSSTGIPVGSLMGFTEIVKSYRRVFAMDPWTPFQVLISIWGRAFCRRCAKTWRRTRGFPLVKGHWSLTRPWPRCAESQRIYCRNLWQALLAPMASPRKNATLYIYLYIYICILYIYILYLIILYWQASHTGDAAKVKGSKKGMHVTRARAQG